MAKAKSANAWERYRRDRKFYFAYPINRPNTRKLIDTGQYGVVQLKCIEIAVREAFKVGFRAGSRSAGKSDGR